MKTFFMFGSRRINRIIQLVVCLKKRIDAFNIGKKSYGINDLKTIDEYSLDKKYNEFALILRKHTISSHENAFDKLVNLFLAKIIDERYHSDELQLLWKRCGL